MKVGGISTKNHMSYLITTVEIYRALKRNNIYSNYLYNKDFTNFKRSFNKIMTKNYNF